MLKITSRFIVTQDFNRLAKMNFGARVAEALKELAEKKNFFSNVSFK